VLKVSPIYPPGKCGKLMIEPATVKRFDEMDPWQEEINSDDEYFRSEIVSDSAGRMRVKVSSRFSHFFPWSLIQLSNLLTFYSIDMY
jgi:hypothetical protein